MKKWIVTILLVAILAAGLLGGLSFSRQYKTARAEGEAAVAAAQAELDAAKEEYTALDPLSSENEAQRLAAERELLAQAREEADRLTAECGELDAAIREAEQKLSEAQSDEEYQYYKAIYDSLAEGMAKVEEYLENS